MPPLTPPHTAAPVTATLPQAPASAPPPCPACNGAGSITLLTSVVPCDCRLDADLAALLAAADVCVTLRTRKVLQWAGVRTLRDLLRTRRADLRATKHATDLTIAEVAAALDRLGVRNW